MALKRRIAEQCIYGVDLNESAVELAKLSLWLATAARELPLTFLDAHLRAGNSLVGLAPGELDHAAEPPAPGAKRRGAKTKAAAGTRVNGRATGSVASSAASGQSTVGASGGRPAQPAQADLWDESGFTQDMFRLVGGRQVIDLMDSRTAEDVRAKTHVLETLDPLAAPYRRLADLVVSRRFGNQMATEVFAAAAQTLLERGGVRLPEATLAPALAEARRIAERQHVFHWELEFPEVYRDGLGRTRGDAAGFDALLGNPPYVDAATLRTTNLDAWAYFPQVYTAAAKGRYDLYAAFVERGLALLNAHGRLAYILPNKWLTTDAGVGLRGLLAERRSAHAVVDFGSYQVFPGVSNYTCLLFARRVPAERIGVAKRIVREGEIALPPRAESGAWQCGEVSARALTGAQWDLTVGDAQKVVARWNGWPTLQEEAKVFQGLGPRPDAVFILAERERGERNTVICFAPALGRAVRIEAELLRPVLQGRDIAPYSCKDGGNRLLFPYRLREGGADLLPADELAQCYPLAWAYLNEPAVRAALEGRVNGRFKGKANWYGFGYPRNMHLLSEPKLVLPDVAARGRVAFDDSGHAIVGTVYGLVQREGSSYARHFLLAALNSPVLTFFLRHRGTDLRGGYFRMMTGYLNPFPLPPIAWELPESERRAQAAWALARIHAGEAERQPPERTAGALGHLPGATLHDTVVGLAEHAVELAARERDAWRAFAARVAGLRPAQAREERVVALLLPPRPGATVPPETADALVVALERAGPALTAPELAALREGFRLAAAEAGAAIHARERAARLIDLLLYRLYGLSPAEIAVVEGDAKANAGAKMAETAGIDGGEARRAVPAKKAGSQSPQGDFAAAGHPAAVSTDRQGLEAEGDMRTASKGGQPQKILSCLDLALERPYCAQSDMNRAMGYVLSSTTGPHYVALGWLAGLLDEVPVKSWLRPTAAGRDVVRAGRMEALWDALLALPALRRSLEFELIEIETKAREQSPAQGEEIKRVWEAELPAFADRAEYLSKALSLDGLSSWEIRRQQLSLAPLEPLAKTAVIELMGALELSGGQSRLTKAQRIARTLARSYAVPLRLDAAWLKPAQLHAMILLAAARAQGLGCVVMREGAMELARGIEALVRGGVDVRVERRNGGEWMAALAGPLALHIRDTACIETMQRRARGTPLAPSAELIAEAVRQRVRAGADGLARGALDLQELGQVCLRELREGIGEPAAHPAAAEAEGLPSRVTIGPPLPLASDLPRLGMAYHFLDEAIRVRSRRAAPGEAVLLTEWLVRQEGDGDALLAINPHLALLYLVAADTGAQAELIGRGPAGWTLDGEPLVAALDARLRGLGYEVWDERYAGDAEALRALGDGLVEQGLGSGLLRPGRASPLDAPDSRWYFKATELLAVAPAGRSVR